MVEKDVSVHVVGSISEVGQTHWDACANPAQDNPPQDPFTSFRFLCALEESGSVGPGTGWSPRYLQVTANGQTIAVAPHYVKSHSQGEYVFDHNWAHAYERAGGKYYPKLQVAVPFTPATGRRFLTRLGSEAIGMGALIEGAVQIATDNQLSSVNITFCTEDEALVAAQMGLLHRTGQQFHWTNENYANFDAFIETLSSRKRKAIRKERRQAAAFGGEIIQKTGDQITVEDWDAFWQFYQDTGARKWGTPYLTRCFFEELHLNMREDILLIFAVRDGQPVAGALNFIGKDTLYGRYWGCSEDHSFLHFEVCYYQAIDYAISRGLKTVEAGAQGEHKLARGYLPVTTHSVHWIGDPGFRNAVQEYLVAERSAVQEENDILTSYGPFKQISEIEKE
jgi:predicted N-acyltransferase